MKRSLRLIAILSLVSISAFSQSRTTVRGGISIGNGDDIIRIDVNNRSRAGDANRRILRLERAVRQLQNMVYDLQDDRMDTPELMWICKIKTSFNVYYSNKELTENAARRKVTQECERKESFSSSCEPSSFTKITCHQE